MERRIGVVRALAKCCRSADECAKRKRKFTLKVKVIFFFRRRCSVERVVKVLTKWEVSHNNTEKVSLPKHGQ